MGALQQDDFKLNVGDERFSELYDNPHFNIDPSAPEFKKTKAMESLIDEKIKRRKAKKNKRDSDSQEIPQKVQKLTDTESVIEVRREKDTSLASLVRSVKAKTQSLQNRKGKR